MAAKELRIGIVGCGNIAAGYGRTLAPYDFIEMTGATDLLPERAQAFTDEFGGKAFATLDEMLKDDAIDLVVNLTIHHAHYEVITRCLEAGKHVHSEKPLSMTTEQAKELVALADARGLRLSCAPITYMGEAQQTAWKAIRDGQTGTIRVVYAEVNHGRIESWHPNPDPFYQVGPLFDVGPVTYPAYTGTSVAARADTAVAVRSHDAWKESRGDEKPDDKPEITPDKDPAEAEPHARKYEFVDESAPEAKPAEGDPETNEVDVEALAIERLATAHKATKATNQLVADLICNHAT